jgi:hypothetical protein
MGSKTNATDFKNRLRTTLTYVKNAALGFTPQKAMIAGFFVTFTPTATPSERRSST